MSSSHHGHAHAVDIHAHFLPKALLDLHKTEAAKKLGCDYVEMPKGFFLQAMGGEKRGLYEYKWTKLDERVAQMDRQGIDVQALSLTWPMPYYPDASFSQDMAEAFNNDASAAHKAYPSRFVGLAALPMLHPDRALAELARVAKLPGIRGVYVGTVIGGHDLSHEMFAPIFAKIAELKLPIFLHPVANKDDPVNGSIGGKRLDKYYLVNTLGNPFETAVAASHIIFSGVLDRHPELEINLPHAGGALPILWGRLDHGYRVRKETKHLPHAPSEYLRRFTYDTISHSPSIMRFIISQVGADRVMIGSDYCADMGYDLPVQFVDGLGLEKKEHEMVMGGTAARLLKL